MLRNLYIPTTLCNNSDNRSSQGYIVFSNTVYRLFQWMDFFCFFPSVAGPNSAEEYERASRVDRHRDKSQPVSYTMHYHSILLSSCHFHSISPLPPSLSLSLSQICTIS